MKALVIDDMVRLGGGKKVALNFADALKEIGLDPYFLTNVDRVEDRTYPVVHKVNYDFRENSQGIVDLLKILNLKRQLAKINTENFGIRLNNHPNVFITKGDINFLHGFSFLDPWIDENGDIVKSLPPLLIRTLGLYRDYDYSPFVPNSKYTKALSERLFRRLGINATVDEVLHPPIFRQKKEISEKKRQVVVLGRISATKSLEAAVKVSNESGIKMIIGGYLNRGDERFLERLRKSAQKNVTIRVNITEEEKKSLLMESSTILSLNRKENFGISVVEGMDFGCIPIVARSGGPWTDIVEEGKYGMGFSIYEEIPKLVERSFNFDQERRERISDSVERFSFDKFRERLRKIVGDIISSRK
ncbi:MAG: glycosyltransferase [Thermoplasmatales archaeon]|nr:glycosyltransferase [Thermoplasmatales archaeon]